MLLRSFSPVPGQHFADDNQSQEGLGSFGGGKERERKGEDREDPFGLIKADVHDFMPVGLLGIAHVVLVVREQESYLFL